jgi:endonuclease/exonuclease/phosphatase family metal-dependent hydrolase
VKSTKACFLKIVALSIVLATVNACFAVGYSFPNGNDRSTLRIISYNVKKFEGMSQLSETLGCPDFESNESIFDRVSKQIPLRIALELALYRPDIVTMQEATGEEKVKQIAEYLGMNYAYFSGNGKCAGAVITRFKIVESKQDPLADGNCPKELFTRHWGRVVLETEDGKLILHTIHLHPVDSNVRKREAAEVIKVVKNDMKSGCSVLVQGDFNHRDNDPEYKMWVNAGLTDTFAKKGIGRPYSVPSIYPKKRIDYIWVCGPLAEKLANAKILAEGAFVMHPDTAYMVLSDHVPTMAIFQNADKEQ